MRFFIWLLTLWGISALGLTFDADPTTVNCVPSVDQYSNLNISIDVEGKAVAVYLLDNNQTVDSPEANAAVAYCQSVTGQAFSEEQQVQINTEAASFDSGALQIADPYAICNQPPSLKSRHVAHAH